jgi:hypothetical protein
MYDFKSVHVGKDLYRAKEHEEDIKIITRLRRMNFPSASRPTATVRCSSRQTRTS